MERIVQGALKGGFHGLLAGIVLGAAGNVMAPPIDYVKMLTWENRYGKTTKFTNLSCASILIDDLVKIHEAKKYNISAYNEAFRNIQSVITLYHMVKTGADGGNDIMIANRMKNYTVRASKAMEAIYISTMSDNAQMAVDVEKAMMNIQLSIEEFINIARENSKNSLPKI